MGGGFLILSEYTKEVGLALFHFFEIFFIDGEKKNFTKVCWCQNFPLQLLQQDQDISSCSSSQLAIFICYSSPELFTYAKISPIGQACWSKLFCCLICPDILTSPVLWVRMTLRHEPVFHGHPINSSRGILVFVVHKNFNAKWQVRSQILSKFREG
jgi:hypothetical protein